MTQPCTYVIFGATGNLSRNKLMPALYHLEAADRLPKGTSILAIGRQQWDKTAYLTEIKKWIAAKSRDGLDEGVFEQFAKRIHIFTGDLTRDNCYAGIVQLFSDNQSLSNNIAFYMAVKPEHFGTVIKKLSEASLLDERHGWRRVVVEKPFGYDLESAEILQKGMDKYLTEDQIYRIDHYLGKSTVQNVLVFRFANLMMEPLWNHNYIAQVQITHSETLGIGEHESDYDNAGALRDVIQSHLLQLMTMVAMEAPVSMDSNALRDEKVKVLKSIRPIPQSAVHAQSFRAQYDSGTVDGEKVKGYLDEEGVDKHSVTETYAALKLYVDNWRWRGVPFYLRTGKRMAKGQSSVSIQFKHPPQQLFRNTQVELFNPNWVLLGIQPSEILRMEMSVKEPGLEMRTRITGLNACLTQEGEATTDAYENLLLDIIEGDQSLFLRNDEVEWAWRVVDPVLKTWSVQREFIQSYPAGTWGPQETRRLFDRDDQFWRHSLEPGED